eukprot:m.467753 g.467753  ORF g.467753 m.467753 type:complete len:184 (-) comp20366_c2_seq11:201-752(-)
MDWDPSFVDALFSLVSRVYIVDMCKEMQRQPSDTVRWGLRHAAQHRIDTRVLMTHADFHASAGSDDLNDWSQINPPRRLRDPMTSVAELARQCGVTRATPYVRDENRCAVAEAKARGVDVWSSVDVRRDVRNALVWLFAVPPATAFACLPWKDGERGGDDTIGLPDTRAAFETALDQLDCQQP